MHKAPISLFIPIFILSACDFQSNIPKQEVTITLSSYLSDTPHGILSIGKEQAIPISQLPTKQYKVAPSGWRLTLDASNLPDGLQSAVYTLIYAPALDLIQVASIRKPDSFSSFTTTSPADSINLSLYFFLVELPDKNYPQEIALSVDIDGKQDVVSLQTSKHMISFEKQMIAHGDAFINQESDHGLNIDVRSSQIDTSVVPVSFFDDILFRPEPDTSIQTTFLLAGGCYRSLLRRPCIEWASPTHHLTLDSHIRLLLLDLAN